MPKELHTCHYACDCREKVLQDYIRAKERLDNNTDGHSLVAISVIQMQLKNYNKAWEALRKLKHE